MPVLAASVPDYMDQFYIFAYNPDAREATDGRLPENAAKKLHIRKVAAHYGYVLSVHLTAIKDHAVTENTSGVEAVKDHVWRTGTRSLLTIPN
jgi:hypothetical protein